MKKISILFIVFSIALAPAFCQFSGGAKLGANISKFGNSNGSFERAKIGAHIGVWARFLASDKIGIQPELLLSLQGSKTEFSNSNFNYITIPLLVIYLINENMSVLAGPQFGFLASAKTKFDGSGTIDEKDFVNSTEIAAALGFMYTLDIVLHFYARVVLGISNILDNNASAARLTNQLFQIGVAYTLFGN